MPRGRPLGLAVVLAGTMPFLIAPGSIAEDRMQLGAPEASRWEGSLARDFRGSVGDRVFFADGSAELTLRARQAIAGQAHWLKHNPGLTVIVEGHADDSGTSEDNMRLSRQRADAVRQRLIELGIAGERIHAVAFGRNQTVADCAGSQCAAQNRRAVTAVKPGAAVPVIAPTSSRKAQASPVAAAGRG